MLHLIGIGIMLFVCWPLIVLAPLFVIAVVKVCWQTVFPVKTQTTRVILNKNPIDAVKSVSQAHPVKPVAVQKTSNRNCIFPPRDTSFIKAVKLHQSCEIIIC